MCRAIRDCMFESSLKLNFKAISGGAMISSNTKLKCLLRLPTPLLTPRKTVSQLRSNFERVPGTNNKQSFFRRLRRMRNHKFPSFFLFSNDDDEEEKPGSGKSALIVLLCARCLAANTHFSTSATRKIV